MRASELTHRVIIQRATEARDTMGHPVQTWTTLATVWAGIEWTPGAEGFSGDRDYSEVPVTVKIRRSSDTVSVREKDRVLVPLGVTTLQEMSVAADTSLVVVDAGVFPPENEFAVRIKDEVAVITATSSNTLTATRGAFGTTAAIHKPGASVIHLVPLDIVASPPTGRREITLTCVRSEVRLPA